MVIILYVHHARVTYHNCVYALVDHGKDYTYAILSQFLAYHFYLAIFHHLLFSHRMMEWFSSSSL